MKKVFLKIKDIDNVTDDLIKIITSDEKRISFMDSNKIDSHGLKTLLMKKMKEGNDDIVAKQLAEMARTKENIKNLMNAQERRYRGSW